MYKNILFATTASPICDNAAKVAFDLAEKYHSGITILHVFGIPSHGFRTSIIDRRTGEEEVCSPDYIDWVKEEMKTTYAVQLEKYPQTRIEAVAGVPHTEILRSARNEKSDLIIMGAHTHVDDTGALRYRNISGSTMQQVATSAKSPVMIVSRPCTACSSYFHHIVFATDFTSKCQYAFEYAVKASEISGGKLTIFHAVDIETCNSGSQEEIEHIIDEAHKKIRLLYLDKSASPESVSVVVREGIPYVEILKHTRENNGDLIVMSHQTKKSLSHQDVIINTVEQVVLRSACPVISVNH